MVHTGDGKGKTTAAMGMALRGVGQGFRVLMIQFIKGSWNYGELKAVKKLDPDFEIIPMGKGFIYMKEGRGPTPEDLKAVDNAWKLFRKKMKSDEYYMIILDEINIVIDYNLLDIDAAINAILSFEDPTVVIMKHTNPCGIGSDKDLSEAYQKAFATDPISSFGGIMIANRTLPLQLAMKLKSHFLEVLLAPDFDPEALETLYKKDISVEEGVKLGVKAVNAAVQRDIASGNGIDVVTITKTEVKRVLSKEIITKIEV